MQLYPGKYLKVLKGDVVAISANDQNIAARVEIGMVDRYVSVDPTLADASGVHGIVGARRS